MRIVVEPVGAIASAARVQPVSRVDRTGEQVFIIRMVKAMDRAGRPVDPAHPVGKLSDEALARDREVRGHEHAHLSALGPYAASGILYDTASTPDGAVATGGRVAVDLAEVPGDPEATLRKARTVLNAAQAPGDPSAADMRVAAEAYRLMAKAESDMRVSLYA